MESREFHIRLDDAQVCARIERLRAISGLGKGFYAFLFRKAVEHYLPILERVYAAAQKGGKEG